MERWLTRRRPVRPQLKRDALGGNNMSQRTLIQLVLGLQSTVVACAPTAPQPIPEALCEAAAPDTGSWQQLKVGSRFGVTAPPELRPDTSVQLGLIFYHGGYQWADSDLIVYWDVSYAAYGGVMHDSLKASLARADAWHTPSGCEAPATPGWVIRSSVNHGSQGYSASVWMMPDTGSQDHIYHLRLEARTESAFVNALPIIRSLRLVAHGGA
jgi:hypothetical protein